MRYFFMKKNVGKSNLTVQSTDIMGLRQEWVKYVDVL